MNKELIERFFQKQCTSREAKKVVGYFKANPDLREKYLGEFEWNSIEPRSAMPEEFWMDIWHNIQKKNKAKLIFAQLKRIAVAASVIAVIGVIYFLLTPKKQITRQISSVNQFPKTKWRTLANTTTKINQIILEDSSVVILQSKSSIQYEVPFPYNKREVILDGEAKFTVAKNKSKPFTVYAGALATTALGTIFTVKTNRNKKDITIKLFRGKVLIHATDDNLRWQKDIYLLPGEQLQFNSEKMLVDVEKINKPLIVNLNKIKKPGTDSISKSLSFSNTRLPDVMQKLSAYYNVKIMYDSLVIASMNFTGTVSKNDSLPIILKAISQMNNLDVIQNNNDYIINKHQQ